MVRNQFVLIIITNNIETHPKCNNCQRLRLQCGYEMFLKWEENAESQGIAFGRSKLSLMIRNQALKQNLEPGESKVLTLSQQIASDSLQMWVNCSSQSQFFLNVTNENFYKLYNIIEVDNKRIYKRNFKKSVSNLFESSFTNTFESIDYFQGENIEICLFNYFANNISPHCLCWIFRKSLDNNSNITLNVFLSHFVPLSNQSSVLYYSILAASARQLTILGYSKFSSSAKYYLSKVLKLLPHVIAKKSASKNYEDWDDVLATMVILCFTEISYKCRGIWLVHLNGAKLLLNQNLITSSSSNIGMFSIQYILMQEVFGNTIWNKLQMKEEYLFQKLNCINNENISLVSGTSLALLSIINKITLLGRKLENLHLYPNRNTVKLNIINERNSLELDLINLRQVQNFEGLDEDEIVLVKKLAEIKRLTALIYLFVKVDIEYLYSGRLSDNDTNFKKLYNEKYKQIAALSTNIIKLIDTLSQVTSALLWTFLIIGVASIDSDEHRCWLLSKLTKLEKVRLSGNVKVARFAIESVWKEHDLDGGPKRWLEIVKFEGLHLSLA